MSIRKRWSPSCCALSADAGRMRGTPAGLQRSSACAVNPANDPHHLIGHGQGGMGTKAHDLFVIPLCRAHHDALHADTVAFEEKHGSQLVLLFRLSVAHWLLVRWHKLWR